MKTLKTLGDLRVEKSTVAANLSQQIQQFILDRKLKSGDGLPSQRELSMQLHVGVPAVREALKKLEGIGLLEISHGKRTVVKQVDAESLLNSISPTIELTEVEVVHLLEFKEIIETRCAQIAATRVKQDDLVMMKSYLEMMRQARDQDSKFAEADYMFHLTVVKSAYNPIMDQVMHVIERMLKRALEKAAGLHEWRSTAIRMHERIYKAILAHNGKEAARAVEDLIEETLKRYKNRTNTRR